MHGSELEARSGDTPVDYNAYVFRLEATCFQFNDNIAMKANMIKQQIDIKFFIANHDMIVAPHKRKPNS